MICPKQVQFCDRGSGHNFNQSAHGRILIVQIEIVSKVTCESADVDFRQLENGKIWGQQLVRLKKCTSVVFADEVVQINAQPCETDELVQSWQWQWI